MIIYSCLVIYSFSDIGIKYVSSYCLQLRELSISDCSQITDFGLYELAKLGPNLRYLSVAKCDQISDAGVKQIARLCYKLRYLNVRGCEAVSDEAIEMLARSCSRLRSLDLGKCDVTDVGLKMLSENCPNLKKLSVKSCEMVSDRGIQCVAYYCRGLQQLNIQDCPITQEGYRMVKKFCKRCIIEHSHPGFFWKKRKKEWTEKMLPYVFILHFLVTFHIDDANKSANPTTNLCSSFLDLNNWEKINQYHFWSFTSKADLLFCSWFQFNKTVKDKDILKLLFSWL